MTQIPTAKPSAYGVKLDHNMNQTEFKDFLITEFAFEFHVCKPTPMGSYLILRHPQGLEVKIGNFVARFYAGEDTLESNQFAAWAKTHWFYLAQFAETRLFLREALKLPVAPKKKSARANNVD